MSLRRKAASTLDIGYRVKDGVYGFSTDFEGPTMMQAPVLVNPPLTVQAPTQATCDSEAITSNRQAQQHMESYFMSSAPQTAMDAVYLTPDRVQKAASIPRINQMILSYINEDNRKSGTHHLKPIDIFNTVYTTEQLSMVQKHNNRVVQNYRNTTAAAKRSLLRTMTNDRFLPAGSMRLYAAACKAIHDLEEEMKKRGIHFKGKETHNAYRRDTAYDHATKTHPQRVPWNHKYQFSNAQLSVLGKNGQHPEECQYDQASDCCDSYDDDERADCFDDRHQFSRSEDGHKQPPRRKSYAPGAKTAHPPHGHGVHHGYAPGAKTAHPPHGHGVHQAPHYCQCVH